MIRFNYEQGIAPYNRVTVVSRNSRAVAQQKFKGSASYGMISYQCDSVTQPLNVSGIIRVDVRRLANDEQSPFAMVFDVPAVLGPILGGILATHPTYR